MARRGQKVKEQTDFYMNINKEHYNVAIDTTIKFFNTMKYNLLNIPMSS